MKHSFMIELIPENGDERTVLRNWAELDGYVEVVWQTWESGRWVDTGVSPAIEVDKFLKVANVLNFYVKEGLV